MKYRAIRIGERWLAQRRVWGEWETIGGDLRCHNYGNDLRFAVEFHSLATLKGAMTRIAARLAFREPTIDEVVPFDPSSHPQRGG